MSSATPAPVMPSALPSAAVSATARTERQLRMLEELAELGMKLARSVAQVALAEADPPPQGDPALQFCRYARAVRQTISLEARIAADGRQRNVPARPARDHAARRKARIKGIIETSIIADSDGADSEALRLDLAERLDDPEFGTEFANSSIGEIVATICRDLGVAFDCSQWTDEELGEADPGDAEAATPCPPGNPAQRHRTWQGDHAVTAAEIDPCPD